MEKYSNILRSETGGATAYLLIAVFIMGLLTVTVLSGSTVNTTTQQTRMLKGQIEADLQTAINGINDCVLNFPAAVDVDGDGDIDTTDNPNAPYPIYSDDSTGGSGDTLRDIKCPGSDQNVYSTARGQFFPLIGDTAKYTTTYVNSSTEGIQIIFDRVGESHTWDMAIDRLDQTLSECQAEVDDSTGSCATGSCFTYWVKRLSTCP